MIKVVHVPSSLDSLLGQISSKFDQTEAADVIHELRTLYPTKQDSFDQNDLYGAFKQLYVLGDIDHDGDQKVLEILSRKASKKDDIFNSINIYKKESSPRKDDFVGRDADVSNIIQLVTNPRVPGINLFGDSGVGKTTLANEVSMKIKKDFERQLFIDLRGTKDTNAVYFKVLEEFKLTAWDYNNKRIYTHLRNLTTKTLLILDNVEQFLSTEKEDDEKKRKEFLEFLRTMMSSEASKRGCLKVILTSRMQIGNSLLEKVHFKEYELKHLTSEHSRMLMGWRLGDEFDVKQEKVLNEIADICRNTPYLLERAEQLMRQNFSKPSEVLEKLNSLKHKGVPERFACISELFESLPNDEIRQVAVKISLLQRPFSVSTAMKITDISSDYDAELDLEMLVINKIITAEDVNGERKYDLHDLFREFVTSYLCKVELFYEKAYGKAENQFVEHFSKVFRQHAKNLDKDFVDTYKELEEDKANLELSIDLVTRKEAFDLILQSEDVKETASVAMLFEAFKSIKERRNLFGEWAKIVEKKENWLSSANFRCWESIQLADMEGTQSAHETLKRAQMSLAKAMLILTPEQIKAAKGLYKYCSGRIKWMSSANLIDKSSKEEKKRLLEQALSDLKQSLAIHEEIYGDHTLTSRTLNLIGNCYMERGEPSEALESYQQAMGMKMKVVGSEKHFDIPIYYNQLSQVYEALGKKETPSSSLFQENYQKAVGFINKALGLQKELRVNDTVETATFQRNMANILIGLERYDQALEYAQKSCEIRKTNFGKHPETVRILYLIGVIHEKSEDLEAALQSYEEAFTMEESLPDDNHSVVRKRLCSKLEGLCNTLDEEDKLKLYGPRMEKIRKETDADAAKKTDDDTAGAEEGTDVITLDNKGGYYDFSSDYFFLEVPCNAVKTPVKVRYKVDPCCYQPPMAGITTSISYFLEMSSSMTVELNEPITVTLMHSGPGKEYGYETTAMAFNQDKDVWEDLPDVRKGSKVSNLGPYKSDSIRIQISKLTILGAVTRLITDRFQVTPKGCVVRSSVCPDVTVEFPEGAVDKTVEGTMKLLIIKQRILLKHGNYGYRYPCPILLVDGFDNIRIQKPVTITMPHPCPEEYSLEKVKIMRLSDEPEKVVENNWEDITDQVIHLKQMKKDQECFIELQVQQFSWTWVSPLEMLQGIFSNLISSPPSYVRIGLFKTKDEPRRPLSMLKAFKVTLRCVANIDDKHMKEMKETHEELAIATSVNPMRPGDKALINVEGEFEEQIVRRNDEKPTLVFLRNEKFDTQLNVCRKREGALNRGLIISLYKEIDTCFLCELSTGETEDLEKTVCYHGMYKIRRTPPRGYFVIVNINKFDSSTGLEERLGSNRDVQNLESVFKDLDFEVNLLCDDPKSQEIRNFLYNLSQEDFSDYDCFGLCIMSHGADECFYGSDGVRITWSEVLDYFRYQLPTLRGKPKLFLFQACRIASNIELDRGCEHDVSGARHGRGGERERRGEHPTRSGSPTRPSTGNSSSRITYLPSDVQDTLVVYSCFQGHESFRNTQDGTFFTQSLVRVLRENVNNEDMSSMVTMVTNELATQLGNKQVPERRNTLTKKLYFKPEMKFPHFYE